MSLIRIQPIATVQHYDTCYNVYSPIPELLAAVFVSSAQGNKALPDEERAPVGSIVSIYPPASVNDDFVQDVFGFEPGTHLRFDGHHGNNPSLADITRQGIDNFVRLCERKGMPVVIIDDSGTRVYCSKQYLQ